MKIIRFILVIIICSHNAFTSAKEINYFIIGSSVAPLQYDKNTMPINKGIITEIVTSVFEGTGVSVNMMVIPWWRQIETIKEKKVSNWLVYSLPDWLSVEAEYSEPLFDWSHVIVSRRETGFDIENVEQFPKYVLLLVRYFDYPGLNEWKYKDKFKFTESVASTSTAIKMLANRRADLFIGERGRINFHIHELQTNHEIFKFQEFSSVIAPKKMRLAYDPSLPEDLKRLIDQGIRKLKEQKKIQQLLRQYHWAKSSD